MEAATAGELEAATAGEYDENPEQTLRMLQRRGENSIKQTNHAVKNLAYVHLPLRDWWWLAPVCDHLWGCGRWLLLSWRAHEFNICRMRTTRHESRSLR